jgi:hypothetical protein
MLVVQAGGLSLGLWPGGHVPPLGRRAEPRHRIIAATSGAPDRRLELGHDPSWLCSESACEETNVLLCSSPIEEDGFVCELQEGLTFGDGTTVWACGQVSDPPASEASSSTERVRAPRMGFLDDLVGGAKEALREVTVQHVLVSSQVSVQRAPSPSPAAHA